MEITSTHGFASHGTRFHAHGTRFHTHGIRFHAYGTRFFHGFSTPCVEVSRDISETLCNMQTVAFYEFPSVNSGVARKVQPDSSNLTRIKRVKNLTTRPTDFVPIFYSSAFLEEGEYFHGREAPWGPSPKGFLPWE